MTLGQRLKKARVKKGHQRQQDLSAATGVGLRTIASLEADAKDANPRQSTIEALVAELGPDWYIAHLRRGGDTRVFLSGDSLTTRDELAALLGVELRASAHHASPPALRARDAFYQSAPARAAG